MTVSWAAIGLPTMTTPLRLPDLAALDEATIPLR
jgi:hypothetical protein